MSHLAAVAPSPADARTSTSAASISVSAPAPGTAARLLTARFASPGATGLADLVACAPAAGAGTVAGWGDTLAAAPDRAAGALPPGSAAPATLAAGLAREGGAALLLLLSGERAPPQQQQPPPPSASTTAFLGTLIGRLALRGWATPAAAGLWGLVVEKEGSRPLACASPTTPPLAPALAAVGEAAGAAAVEVLATALILHAAAAASAAPSGPTEGTSRRSVCAAAAAGPAAEPAAAAAAAALLDALGPAAWATSPGLAFLTQDKLLTRAVLPPRAAAALVALLAGLGGGRGPKKKKDGEAPPPPHSETPLAAATAALARAWAAPGAASSLPPPRAAYMAWCLCACLDAAAPGGLLSPGTLAGVIGGVGDRLDSPLQPTRRQGMRVGDALARAIGPLTSAAGDGSGGGFDPADGLFAGCCGEGEGGHARLDVDEWWDGGCAALAAGSAPATAAGTAAATPAPAPAPVPPHEAGAVPWTPALGSAAGGGDGPCAVPTVASLTGPAGGSNGAGPSVPATVAGVGGDAHRPAQLSHVTAALRKGSAGGPGEDDPAGVVGALAAAAILVAAAPLELAGPAAADLARALLHARIPTWADEEAAAAAVPLLPALAGGSGRAAAVVAPPPPQPAAAAASAPRLLLPPSQQRLATLVRVIAADPVAAGGAVAGTLYSPHLDMHQRLLVLDALAGGARALAGGHGGAGGGGGGSPAHLEGWERHRGAATPLLKRNRFAGVAVRWATALLKECDVERHGVDLLGRDAAVLGRLLTTLAAFAECAGPCLPGAQVAAATLELVRAPAVHGSPSPFVRRCALAAAAAAAGAVPPAVVAGAALAAVEAEAAGGRPDAGGAAGDAALLDRLAWARAWAERVAYRGDDPDPQCRLLAAAAAAGFESLAARALEAGGAGGGGGGAGGAGSLFGLGRPLPSGGSAALGNRLERVLLPGAAARVRLD